MGSVLGNWAGGESCTEMGTTVGEAGLGVRI